MQYKFWRFLLLAFLIIFLTLLEGSFLSHLPRPVWLPNILPLFAFIYNLVEKAHSKEGLFVALFSGLCYDIFTTAPIGVYMLSFFIVAYFLKKFLKRYVRFSLN